MSARAFNWYFSWIILLTRPFHGYQFFNLWPWLWSVTLLIIILTCQPWRSKNFLWRDFGLLQEYGTILLNLSLPIFVLQILAIFAFATTTSVNTYLEITANKCNGTAATVERVAVGYPFEWVSPLVATSHHLVPVQCITQTFTWHCVGKEFINIIH